MLERNKRIALEGLYHSPFLKYEKWKHHLIYQPSTQGSQLFQGFTGLWSMGHGASDV